MILKASDKVVLKIEGQLAGKWLDELRTAVCRHTRCSQPLEIDVSDLNFADEDGEKTLGWLHTMGARFRGEAGCYIVSLFGRLKIPLYGRGGFSKRRSQMPG